MCRLIHEPNVILAFGHDDGIDHGIARVPGCVDVDMRIPRIVEYEFFSIIATDVCRDGVILGHTPDPFGLWQAWKFN